VESSQLSLQIREQKHKKTKQKYSEHVNSVGKHSKNQNPQTYAQDHSSITIRSVKSSEFNIFKQKAGHAHKQDEHDCRIDL
jgi:hypothetical protein